MPGEREIAEIYTKLRDQALGFGPVEIKAGPVVEGGRVLGVVMDMGYETAVVSIVGLSDGTTSTYVSNGGGMIGGGDSPPVAAASKRWVEVAEAAAGLLPESSGEALPADGEIRFNVLTVGPRLSATAAEPELAAGRHALSPLYRAGQDVITEIRLVNEARQQDEAQS